MAKLNAYYGLCPLVDYKNFIGISKDIDHGHIIVTQSKNIVIKYRVRTTGKICTLVLFSILIINIYYFSFLIKNKYKAGGQEINSHHLLYMIKKRVDMLVFLIKQYCVHGLQKTLRIWTKLRSIR